MKKKIIYISGKVTGLDYEQCYAKFLATERWLQYYGFEVINPMKRVPKGTNWTPAMLICREDVKKSDALFLISDWTDSDGAKVEKRIAEWNKIQVFESFYELLKQFNTNVTASICYTCGHEAYLTETAFPLCKTCIDEIENFIFDANIIVISNK